MKKKTFRVTVSSFGILLLSLYEITGLYNILLKSNRCNEWIYRTGVIERTEPPTGHNYYGTFLIKFDDIGLKSVSVSKETYTRFNKGDRISWGMYRDEHKRNSGSFMFYTMSICLISVFIIITIICFIIYFISKIINFIYNNLED